ncbi:MAG TPA: hypothetical protein VHP64_01650, partial [Candidatus Limnocylindria bacterium]|nr:hypothetical protein [Candidatus Limnocylindria bacterium]
RRAGVAAHACRIDALLDPPSHQVAGPHPGLAGEMLQRVDAARIEADRHGTLVGRAPFEARPRSKRTVTAPRLKRRPVAAAARRVGRAVTWRPIAGRIGAVSTATAPLARLPVAAWAGTARLTIVAVAIGTVVWAAWAAAAVETHRFNHTPLLKTAPVAA